MNLETRFFKTREPLSPKNNCRAPNQTNNSLVLSMYWMYYEARCKIDTGQMWSPCNITPSQPCHFSTLVVCHSSQLCTTLQSGASHEC